MVLQSKADVASPQLIPALYDKIFMWVLEIAGIASKPMGQ